MDIKLIVDKALKESDVQAQDWSVADRVSDINDEYRFRVEKAAQIASKHPMSRAETISETFSIVEGANTFTRTIKDTPIFRVDYMPTGGTKYERMSEDFGRRVNGWCFGDQKFHANEKQIFIENGRAGTLRITYAHGSFVPFTQADYDLGSAWPSPDFLPEVFHPLLWLRPALRQASYYKKDRVASLKEEVDRLELLFDNHYGRNAVYDSEVVTDEEDMSCFGSGYSRR